MAAIFDRRDAEQYLTGVWVGVKDKRDDSIKPWFCFEVYVNRKEVVCLKLLREVDGENKMKNVECDDEAIDISCPAMGAISLNGIPLFLSRRTQRQWRRGWRSGQSNFTDPSEGFRNYVAGDRERKYRRDSHQPALADAIYNPVYSTMDKAVADIYSGETFGAAISQDFYVYCDPECKLPVIGYKSQAVGTVNEEVEVKLFDDSLHLTESLSELMAE